MPKKEIVRILCGSHLYGTNIESSDEDLKTVFVPSGANILLQRANNITSTTSKEQDVEQFPVHRFLQLLKSGQTVALDILFAPAGFYRGDPTPEWEKGILFYRDRLVSKNVKSFVGYCRQQSAKYCVKVDRATAVQNAMAFFNQNRKYERIYEIPNLQEFIDGNEFSEIVGIGNAQGKIIPHVSICETRIPTTATTRDAHALYGTKWMDYGDRVLKAKNMDGKDWKALYHAVRVAEQAKELLKTGKITFPRPEKEFLLAIRQGRISYQVVSDILEENLGKVEQEAEKSTLPEEVNVYLADSIVESLHLKQIREDYSMLFPKDCS